MARDPEIARALETIDRLKAAGPFERAAMVPALADALGDALASLDNRILALEGGSDGEG